MEVRKFVIKETGIITVGQVICVAVMWGVFALLGFWDKTVLLGGIFGAVLAVLNFLFMAIGANAAADAAERQDVKGGKARIRSSFYLRMIGLFLLLFALTKSELCNPLALVIPFLFVRPIITVTEFFRKPEEENK